MRGSAVLTSRYEEREREAMSCDRSLAWRDHLRGWSLGLTVSAAAGVVARYVLDLRRARARLARFDAHRSQTPLGPVSYCEFGDGPPVLMVHGFMGGYDLGETWRALVPDGYRVIIPSRFGYPGAPMPTGATPAKQADAFAALLDALEIGRVTALAISAGSSSMVQFALRHPERLSGLVLACPNAPQTTPGKLPPRALAPLVFSQPVMWAWRLLARSALERSAGVPRALPLDADARHDINAAIDGFYPLTQRTRGNLFDAFGLQDIASYPFEAITAPTLVVHARDDPLIAYQDSRAMADRIPHARFVTVSQGGHLLIHRDPHARAEIAAFLAQCADNSTSPQPLPL